MCGIVGYIGPKAAGSILIEGLKRLEYRGYDSAGICVYDDGKLFVDKCPGRIAALEEKLAGETHIKTGTIGIAHTRWATHGEPNQANAHPHIFQPPNLHTLVFGIILGPYEGFHRILAGPFLPGKRAVKTAAVLAVISP